MLENTTVAYQTEEEKKEKILNILKDEKYKPLKIKELSIVLAVPHDERDFFNYIINQLEKEGKVFITQKFKVMLPEKLGIFKGEFRGNQKGFGFVSSPEYGADDIFIPATYVGSAMNKDSVLCQVINESSENKRAEGEIVKILKRGYSEIIGTFQKDRNYGFVIPDDKKLGQDIYIQSKNNMGAVTGHKVAVKILKAEQNGKNREGKIVDILGHLNDPGVDITAIVRQYEIPSVFDEKLMKETLSLPNEVLEYEINNRKDLRQVIMVTIDGDDTKDIDDAVSIEILNNGFFRLGVHIADVSHYVTEGSELNKEALKRGTSVYLADRVIPMLPHKLSNGICSLNEGVDRLAMSCIMDIDSKGVVLNHEIIQSVINVNERMTYTIVNDLLTSMEKSEYFEKYNNLVPMFKNMETLACTLREKRIKRGAIEFDFPETKIIVNEQGVIVDIKPYSRNIATSIIEEFMLVCNETVAEEYFWLEIPFVYRTHEEPDSEKFKSLNQFLHSFGYNIKGKTAHPGSIQTLLSGIENTPYENLISRVVLRSFKQARYSDENIGHFGLAAKYYSHFTSPIRRYPDLQIHRIIKAHIEQKDDDKFIIHICKILPEVCKQCSITERLADSCQRDVETLKKVEYMVDKVGMEFEGIISGVTNWGLYVELENTIEGMVSISSIDDDYYVFDKERLKYIGERTKKTYSLGDKVTVILIRANVEEKSIDFHILCNDNY